MASGASWVWAYGPGASASPSKPSRQLTAATDRVVTWRVAGHAIAQFSIDGRHDEALAIVERRDDLWIWRNGERLFRGRIVGAQDRIDADRHRVQFTAIDYRGLLSLAAKIEPPVPTFTDVDQAQIPWQLIQDWQALDGGNWGIVEGVGTSSGTLRTEPDLTPFMPVGEAIDRVLNRDDGGEWEIDAELQLNRWFPQRGTVKTTVLDYGGIISTIEKSTPEFGNAAGVVGAQETTPQVVEHADVATDERGRWTVAQSDPSLSVQAEVNSKATWALDQAYTVENSWTATFAPRRWDGPDHIWIGDTAQLRVQSGRLAVAGPHRCVELRAVCGDHGTETISAGLVGVEGA